MKLIDFQKKKFFKQYSVVAKTIFAMLIFIMFSTIFFIFTGNYLTKQYENEIVSYNKRYIKYTNQSIDNNLHNTVFKTLLKYVNNENYKIDYTYSNNYVNSKKIIRILDSLCYDVSENPLLFDIIVFYKEDNKIMTRKGLFNYDYFLDNNKWLMELIDNSNQREIKTKSLHIDYSKHDTYFSFLSGISFYTVSDDILAIALIDSNNLYNLISEANLYSENNILIFDANNKLVYSTSDELLIDELSIVNNIDIKTSINSDIIEINNSEYTINHLKSEKNGFKYITLYPLNLIKSKVREISLINFAVFFVIFILLIMIILYLWKTILYPLNKIVNVIKLKEAINIKNEFDLIDILYSKFYDIKEEYKDFKEENQPLIKQRLLEKLIYKDKYNIIEHEYMKYFKYINFKIFILASDELIDLRDIKRIVLSLEQKCLKINIEYEYFRRSKKLWNLIINYDDETFDFKEIIEYILNIEKINILCFSSEIAKTTDQLNLVYRQMETLVMYRRTKSDTNVLTKNDVIINNDATEKLLEIEEVIYQYLIDGAAKEVKALLKELNITGYEIPYKSNWQCAEYLITIIEKVTLRLGVDLKLFLTEEEMGLIKNFNDYNYFVDCERYENIIKNITIQLAKHINKINNEDDDIIRYIKNNFTCEISLQHVADTFKMNSNYLSSYIKRVEGISYTQLITRLRLSLAIEMLISTNISIDNLTKKLGMYNKTSFIRFFKKNKGCTPSQYRRNYQKMKINN